MGARNLEQLVSDAEIYAVLREFNPWWDGARAPDLPDWRRAAFSQVLEWVERPPARRAVLLTGARRVGKTTLLLQVADRLIERGVASSQVIYATFDHPLLKLAGIERVLRAWRELHTIRPDLEYLLLDEVQSVPNWEVWLKHQVDFHPQRRIVVTGSAIPLSQQPESGVGRWHTIRMPTMSFAEYLHLRAERIPDLPEIPSLSVTATMTQPERMRIGVIARDLVPAFHEYLLRGGFPETARVESLVTAQRLLREDIVDKVLKRDMTALYGVRRVVELERLFLYLCRHDAGTLNIPTLCSTLELTRSTVNNFLSLLEEANLIYRLRPHGYGKEVLRGKYKVYLADAAIAGSVLLRGRSLLTQPELLGLTVETAFFKHLFTHYYQQNVGFSYWQSRDGFEVDVVAELDGAIVPFEVKYTQSAPGPSELRGLREFCALRRVSRGYVITRETTDFGPLAVSNVGDTQVLAVPAVLACYWLSRIEMNRTRDSL